MDLKKSPHLALIGLGVMGSNLAGNVLSKGYQLQTCEVDTDLRQRFNQNYPDTACHSSLSDLVDSLAKPRCVILLIKAGNPVDHVIETLLPLLDQDDIIVDLGNSHYKDTERRCEHTAGNNIRFIGCGISGGAEGAKNGPAMMPGGDISCYPMLQPFFSDITASYKGTPCVTWTGSGGAGHFVKMVHNGIEYADMQLIAESYQIMRDGLGMEAREIGEVFGQWNKGPIESYLIEATTQIFKASEADGKPLINCILDKAGQKGTGGWATEAALAFGVAATLITEAVFARVVSSQKESRKHYQALFPRQSELKSGEKHAVLKNLETAFYAAKVINYAQGFMLMEEASKDRGWNLDLKAIASGWRAGCIIRGKLLDEIVNAYQGSIQYSLLDAPGFSDVMVKGHGKIREIIRFSLDTEIPSPCFANAIAFFDGIRHENGSANLIQAQRDYFGAHTFERNDRDQGQSFHADWDALTKN